MSGHKISAIVIASGRAARFGENKLMKPVAGKPMAVHVLDLVQNFPFDEKILVTRFSALARVAAQKGFFVLDNPDYAEGKSASIRYGTAAASEENAYFFFVADQPFLTAEVVKTLWDRFCLSGRVTYPLVNGKAGNPVIFPPSYRKALLALSGDKGGRALAQDDWIGVPFSDMRPFKDIDTIESYNEVMENEG